MTASDDMAAFAIAALGYFAAQGGPSLRSAGHRCAGLGREDLQGLAGGQLERSDERWRKGLGREDLLGWGDLARFV